MAKRFRNLVGPKIRELRMKRGLTQELLAARLQLSGATGLDRATVAKIESQIRSVFDYELLAFAHVFGVSPNHLAPDAATLAENLPKLSTWREK